MHIVQFTILHQRLHTATIVGDLSADTAELIIRHLEDTRQTVDAPQVVTRNLDTGLVTDIMVDRCPSVLQRGAQLQFKPEVISRQAADIMEGVVAEAVQLVQHPFVHGVIPIDLEQLFYHRRDAVHIVGVEGDDTSTDKVGDVTERGIFRTFECQFAFE